MHGRTCAIRCLCLPLCVIMTYYDPLWIIIDHDDPLCAIVWWYCMPFCGIMDRHNWSCDTFCQYGSPWILTNTGHHFGPCLYIAFSVFKQVVVLLTSFDVSDHVWSPLSLWVITEYGTWSFAPRRIRMSCGPSILKVWSQHHRLLAQPVPEINWLGFGASSYPQW